MPKTLVIFNPYSDHRRSREREAALRAMAKGIAETDWAITEHPGHAADLALQAARQGFGRVVTLGGDGTAHEAINGLMQIEDAQRPELGIVPIGSGNDFTIGAGVPAETAQAMERALRGASRPIDAALIRDNRGRSEYFCNVAGIGFDGYVNIHSRGFGFLHGFPMYLAAVFMTLIRDFRTPHMKITHEAGGIELPALMLSVSNGPREGGGFQITPGARVDDGQLNFILIRKVSRLRALQLLPKIIRAEHMAEPEVTLGRTASLSLEADGPLAIHLDGEIYARREENVRQVEIQIQPAAIRIAT